MPLQVISEALTKKNEDLLIITYKQIREMRGRRKVVIIINYY